MKRWMLTALVVAAALAGCQGDEQRPIERGSAAQQASPAQPGSPPRAEEVEPTFTAPPDPETEGELEGPPSQCPRDSEGGDRDGDVVVVDLTGKARVAPGELEPAKDVSLECLEWSGWGEDEASAQGVARTLVCEPTCANGQVAYRPAQLTVSDLGACDGRRAYRAGSLTVGRGEDARELDVYLDAGC